MLYFKKVRIVSALNIFASEQFVGKTPAASKVLPIEGGTQVFSKRGHCILLKDKIDIIQSGNIDWFSDYRILSLQSSSVNIIANLSTGLNSKKTVSIIRLD